MNNCKKYEGLDIGLSNDGLVLLGVGEYKGSTLVIPDGVVEVAKNAFLNNSTIREVIFSDTVEVVFSAAFSNSKIEKIKFGKGLVDIDSWAFLGCESLKEVVFPDSLRSIRSMAFFRCIELKRVVFNEGLTVIEECSFTGTGITEITIPNSVKKIGAHAFEELPLKKVVIGNGVETIGEAVFKECKHLKEIAIPDNVKYIKEEAFRGCSGLEKVILNEGLKEIDRYAFYLCSFPEIHIPDSVEIIGFGAFASYFLCDVYGGHVIKDMLAAFVFAEYIDPQYSAPVDLHIGDSEEYVLLRLLIPSLVNEKVAEFMFSDEALVEAYLDMMPKGTAVYLFPFIFETAFSLLKKKEKGKEVLKKLMDFDSGCAGYLINKGRVDDLMMFLDLMDTETVKKAYNFVFSENYSADVKALMVEKAKTIEGIGNFEL